MGEKYEVYKNNEHDCIHWNIYGWLFTRAAEKETTSSIQEKRKDTKEDAPVEKQQEQEKNEESQAIKTNEQVEHKQEEVPTEEKIEETTPVLPTEQPMQNNEQKVESNEKQEKFLVVIDPGHQQKANLNLEPIGRATTQKYKVTDGTTGVVTKKK